MNAFIIYQLKVGFSIALFISLYYLLLRKETFYLFNRLYILISLFLSLVLPLIKLSDIQFGNPHLFTVFIDSVYVFAGYSEKSALGGIRFSILEFIYYSVCVLCLCHFIYQFVHVFLIVKKNQISRSGKYKIVNHSDNTGSFSFFNLIFLSSGFDKLENDQILIHEITHVKQKHSYDLLLVQIIKVFQWFNPFFYFLEKSLKETHEYLADQEVINQNGQSENYKQLLVSRAFGINQGFLSFFNYSLIKNRLAMITKEKSPFYKGFKYLLVLPLMVFLTYILSCENKTSDDGLISPPRVPSASSNFINEGDTVYIYADKSATFQGGSMVEFKEWVQNNVVYPPMAVQSNISGRVVASFVVNPKGKICKIKILKSPSDILSNEVIRIINESPIWEPGKMGNREINQQFVIPVIFQLN